jgi:hypothetical protein
MYTEGSCFGLDLIADEIKVSSLMVVLSVGGIGALSGQACPSGSGGIVWPLTAGTPPHPYLLPSVLADYSRVGSGAKRRKSAHLRKLLEEGTQ